MPLTAYSISEEKELDVEQVLLALSQKSGQQAPGATDQIPDSWREILRTDLECPCCFVTGADVVKEAISRTSKKAIRQACFRFVSPGHRPQCDYAANESTGFTPENLVEFAATNSNLTKAVRELVCSGIHTGAFSQKTIRDMREWFFEEKVKTSFQVTLNSQVPRWLDMLWRIASSSLGQLPQGVPLTREIAAMPGFDWSIESARVLGERYQTILNILREKRLGAGPAVCIRTRTKSTRPDSRRPRQTSRRPMIQRSPDNGRGASRCQHGPRPRNERSIFFTK